MDGNRLTLGLGWWSVGVGLTQLTLAKPLCRWLKLPARSGLVRALGARDVLLGLGLLLGAGWRPAWWGRARAEPHRRLDDMLDAVHAPGESWRGSGLAEDVGVPPHGADAEANEAERQRRMKDAQRQLGLPDPDARGMH